LQQTRSELGKHQYKIERKRGIGRGNHAMLQQYAKRALKRESAWLPGEQKLIQRFFPMPATEKQDCESMNDRRKITNKSMHLMTDSGERNENSKLRKQERSCAVAAIR